MELYAHPEFPLRSGVLSLFRGRGPYRQVRLRDKHLQ